MVARFSADRQSLRKSRTANRLARRLPEMGLAQDHEGLAAPGQPIHGRTMRPHSEGHPSRQPILRKFVARPKRTKPPTAFAGDPGGGAHICDGRVHAPERVLY